MNFDPSCWSQWWKRVLVSLRWRPGGWLWCADWQTEVVVPIVWRGWKSDCSNYRPIELVSSPRCSRREVLRRSAELFWQRSREGCSEGSGLSRSWVLWYTRRITAVHRPIFASFVDWQTTCDSVLEMFSYEFHKFLELRPVTLFREIWGGEWAEKPSDGILIGLHQRFRLLPQLTIALRTGARQPPSGRRQENRNLNI